MIKLLIGGSPCTYWSIAQNKATRETAAEGLGWELFKNYLIAREKFRPDFFLYENNKSAAPAIKEQIRAELGVWGGTLYDADTGARYIEINSALVSAQNRQRFYVHNCGDVQQPADRGILLKDILETGTAWRDKSHCIDANYYKATNGTTPMQKRQSSERMMVAEPMRIPEYGNGDKSRPILACYAHKGVGEGSLVSDAFPDNPNKQKSDFVAVPVGTTPSGKSYCLTSTYYKGQPPARVLETHQRSMAAIPVNVTPDGKSQTIKAQYEKTSIANICQYKSTYGAMGVAETTEGPADEPFQGAGKDPSAMRRVYEVRDGLITIKGREYPIKLADGFYIIRKLTVTECCRLQTLPDDYCRAVSATQGYKGLGNGWTAEVIIHILSGALANVPRDEEIVVLSMYDGIGTGRYCLDKMGFKNVKYFAYEIDKYAMQIATTNYPDIIECGDAFQLREEGWKLGGTE